MKVSIHKPNIKQGDKNTFDCGICGKSFATLATRKEHTSNVHEGQRPFSCEFCGQMFARKVTQKKHIKN